MNAMYFSGRTETYHEVWVGANVVCRNRRLKISSAKKEPDKRILGEVKELMEESLKEVSRKIKIICIRKTSAEKIGKH